MTPWRAVALLLASLALAAATAQSPEAVGVAPDRLIIADAQAGESYVRTVHYQHQFDSGGVIRVEVDGPEGAWVTTDPASGFLMPPRTNRDVQVTIAVPANVSLGNHTTTLRLIRSEATSGSATVIERSVGVHLDIAVGGDPVVRLTWLGVRADDALAGEPVHAFAQVRNDGNVRTTAEANGVVLPFDGETRLAQANGSFVLRPGETGEVPVTFPDGLDPGQYRARLTAPGGFQGDAPFKVTSNGTAPDGVLRAIVHVPVATAGRPVRIDGWFESRGGPAIAAAVFHAEVHRGRSPGILLDVLESPPLVVASGAAVNLTVYWTPPDAGTYTLVGQVTYDGYRTPEAQDLLNVEGAGWNFPWWLLVVLALVIVLALVLWLWLRRRRRDPRAPAP